MLVRLIAQRLSDVPSHDDWLTAAESATLAGLRVPKRRGDWRLGRWTAKLALRAAGAEGLLEIRAHADGAPEAFEDGAPSRFAISITHTAGRSVCAVAPAGAALGCDLERVEHRGGVLTADYFTAAEQAAVAAAAEPDLVETAIWSAKESALKALREGLRLDTREVVVRLGNARGVGQPLGDEPGVGGPIADERVVGDALGDEPGVDGWRPLVVAYGAGRATFAGWWRVVDAESVLTVVARPAPDPPVWLGMHGARSLGNRAQ
jgi:4'-phosphopantetheinyl transferase